MPQCFLALGGNAGSVARSFDQCLDELNSERAVSVSRVSRYLSTTAVGDDAGSEFLNAAAEVQTQLAPLELLNLLQRTEERHGRIREVHWGPRTLDLDIIFYGDVISNDVRLTLPHPACWYRRFVLDPLEEIAAEFVHPVKQLTVAELRRRLLPRPLIFTLCGGNGLLRSKLCAALRDEFVGCEFFESRTTAAAPAVIAWLGPGDDSLVWDQLPAVPRLDVTRLAGTPAEALRAVVKSALG